MYYRKTEKANKFKTKLGFNPINLMSKEESVTAIIIKSFPGIKRKNDKAVFCFRQKKLICTFLVTNQEQKLIKKDIWTEKKEKNKKEKMK